MPKSDAVRTFEMTRCEQGVAQAREDALAVEEPLELRVAGRSVAVVMRTPGHDRELAAGFLWTEGIVRRREDVLDLVRCGTGAGAGGGATVGVGAAVEVEGRVVATGVTGAEGPAEVIRAAETAGGRDADAGGSEPSENVIDAVLAPGAAVDVTKLTRHVFTSSSCGICSKATIDAVLAGFAPIVQPAVGEGPAGRIAAGVSPAWLATLPERLRAAQAGFAATGGLHASALFGVDDDALWVVREDVGRHNALDKVVGWAFFAERLPLDRAVLLVSGRVSFEIMQKALAAGIPWVAAISAPTSAAVEFARASGQTLVGFLRGERMNVYAGTLAGA